MQFSYLMTINFSNAATATVLEYIGPMLVVVVICVRGRRWPTVREVIAIVFVIVGVFLLATHGDAFQLALSPPCAYLGPHSGRLYRHVYAASQPAHGTFRQLERAFVGHAHRRRGVVRLHAALDQSAGA